jgi:uncharacterized protein YneF (UPF0154 family)
MYDFGRAVLVTVIFWAVVTLLIGIAIGAWRF